MLAFDRTGSGIPLVLLHAFPLSRRMWDANRPALSRNFQLITLDFPGFGESPLVKGEPTLDEFAREVKITLDSMNLGQKVIIAGLSMGGYVLFRFLAKFQEHVRAAVFISTRSAADSDEGRAKRFKNIELVETQGSGAIANAQTPVLFGQSSHEAHLPIVEAAKTLISAQNPKAVAAALTAMASRPDSTPQLPSISVPSLVLTGSEDTIIPPTEMEDMAKALPKADFRVIEKAGHLLSMEKPRAFEEQFLNFLKRRVL